MPERRIAVRAKTRKDAEQLAQIEAGRDQLPGGLQWVTFRVIGSMDVSIAGPGPDGLTLYEVDLQGDVMTESEARAMGGDR